MMVPALRRYEGEFQAGGLGSERAGRVVADAVASAGKFILAGWIDDVSPRLVGELFEGVPVFGGPEQLPKLLAEGVDWLIVAVGACPARERLAEVAVALYHALEDFIKLPRLIDELAPGYRFHLGHYTIYAEETILFATPAE